MEWKRGNIWMKPPSAKGLLLRKGANSGLIFCYIGNAFFTKKYSWALSGKPEAEAMAVKIADTSLKPFTAIQYYGNFCVRVNKGFQVGGFGSCMLRIDRRLDLRRPVKSLLRMYSFKMASFWKGHGNLSCRDWDQQKKATNLVNDKYEDRW